MRFLSSLVSFGVVFLGASSALWADEIFQKRVKPLLENYCFDCHEEGQKKGQIQLDALEGFGEKDFHLWTKVYEQIESGDMPPEDEDQFTPKEKQDLLKWIEFRFKEAASEGIGQRRLLNRREVSAALRDLTGVPIDFSVSMPEDGKVEGFDTGAEGLKDTAETVAQMLEVTRRAVESIRFREQDRGKSLNIDFREHEFTDYRKWIEQNFKEQGVFTKSKRLTCRKDLGVYLPTEWSGDRGSSFLAIPVPADRNAAMRVKMTVKGVRPLPGLPQPMLWVKIGGKYIDYQPVTDETRTLEYVVRIEDCLVEDGVVKIMLRSKVEMPYAVEGFENDDRSKPGEVPGGIGVYRPKYDRKKLRQREEQPVPATVIEEIEIDYDHQAQWPPMSWGYQGEIPDSDEAAKALLKIWIERAWRRSIEGEEVEKYFKLYAKLRAQGLGFDEALRPAFQAVLMSSGFRYHGEGLNSRLSFMLTGGPPDEELKKLALKDGKTIADQVERLLRNSPSEEFFEPFVNQWLVMEQPVTLVMTHLQKQDFRFGRHLKQSMKDETVEYVRTLFAENRPAKELVSSDWTMVNDILALHYGIEGIEGAELRKVSLKGEKIDPRGGGITGHAGIQSMLTWMGDNWVIYRGAWMMHHILDDPPPAPPLEVPELNSLDGEHKGKSFREVLKVHLEDSRCASCHRHMDPIGFAFQNFDLSGRWREVEHHSYHRKEIDGKIEWRGKGDTRPVDTLGKLPKGEEFSSYAEFKELLVKHYLDDIVRGVLKRLTLYGTGRSPNVLDLNTIDGIMEAHRKKGYRLGDLTKSLIASPIFRDHRPANPSKK